MLQKLKHEEKELEDWLILLDSNPLRPKSCLSISSKGEIRLDMIIEPDKAEEVAYKPREEKYHRFKRIEGPNSLYL